MTDVRYKLHLHPWLSQVIAEVAEEQKINNDTFYDAVDEKVKEEELQQKFKSCTNPQCLFSMVPKRARLCPFCKPNIKQGLLENQGPTNSETYTVNDTTKYRQSSDVRLVIDERVTINLNFAT